MSVTFLIGRAGSGKTARQLGRIAEAARAAPLGPPIVWLLPKQATFQAERELTCRLGGFTRVRVVGFELLGRMIGQDCGHVAVPEVTSIGRQMILGHLLRRNQTRLGFFASVARRPGLAAELDATFAEFERSGKTTADLTDLLDQLKHADPADVQGPSLQAKLRDLHLLYDAYTAYLGQERLDQHRRLTLVLQQVEQCSMLRDATVYVDGFHDFTEYERKILAGLGRACRSVEVALTIDPRSPTVRDPNRLPDDLSLFHRTEQTYRKLWFAMAEAGVKVGEVVRLEGMPRFGPVRLARVEQATFEEGERESGKGERRTPNIEQRTPSQSASEESLFTPSPPYSGERAGVRGRASSTPDPEDYAAGTLPAPAGNARTEAGAAPALPADTGGTPAPQCPQSDVLDAPPLTPALSPDYGGEGVAAIHFLITPDPRAEVDAAAREIQSLLMSGYRLRDVAVLVRDLEPYEPLIDTSFREHGLPYFVDRRRTAAHHPLLQFVRSLFQIARNRWPHPAVMTFLRTGLAGVSLLEADEIENYLLQHRLGGSAWDDPDEWAFQKQAASTDDADDPLPPEPFETRDVDAMRRQVVARVKPLLDRVRGHGASTLRDFATELFAALDRFGVRETVARWAHDAEASGDPEQAGEHEQVWAELVDLFEQMVDLLGDEVVSAADLVDVLESGLERFDLALTPPTVDQVLVGQIDRTRTPPLRAAIVLGLNEGQFPHVNRDASILSHAERRELRKRRMELDADPHRRQLDEQFLGYLAFTRASDRLVVTRAIADEDGKPTEPSEFWHRLRALFPDVAPREVPREGTGDVRYLSTPRQLVTSLMEWAREAGDDEMARWQGDKVKEEQQGLSAPLTLSPPHLVTLSSPDPRANLYHWLATHDGSDALAAVRYRAWPALSYYNDAKLSPEVAAKLFPAPLRATAGQLETFAACPFRHYVRYGLRLTQRDAQNVTAVDMSQVYHEVLEIVVGEMLEDRRDWKELTGEQAREMVSTYAAAVAQRLRGELMLSTARNKYLLDRIERTLAQVIASVREMLSRGTLRPAHAGIKFGDRQRLPALDVPTPRGATVKLSGQIDRVDTVAEGDDAGAVTVFDYKLGGGSLPLGNLYHGLSLQLLTYLLVLQSHGEQLAGRPLTPAAAFYVRLLRGLESVKHPDDAGDPSSPDFHLKQKPRGVFHAGFLSALDAEVAPGGASKVVQAHVKKDGQFGYRNASDVADAHEFAALLDFVRARIGQLGDEVMSGKVEIYPYRAGRKTPCPQCDYRPVCRFEPMVNGYHHLTVLKRQDALDAIAGQAGGAPATRGEVEHAG